MIICIWNTLCKWWWPLPHVKVSGLESKLKVSGGRLKSRKATFMSCPERGFDVRWWVARYKFCFWKAVESEVIDIAWIWRCIPPLFSHAPINSVLFYFSSRFYPIYISYDYRPTNTIYISISHFTSKKL